MAIEPINGEFFTVNVTRQTQVRLDSDAVKALLTEEQLRQCSKEISFDVMKTTRTTGKKRDFVMPNFANATPQGLADMLGDVREQIKDLQKYEGMYKEALSARIKADAAEKK